MKSEYKLVLVLSVLMIFALGYAFIVSGTPGKTRGIKYDTERVNSLMQIQSSILVYYSSHNFLPNSLDLIEDSYVSTKLKDPETGVDFEYTKAGDIDYTLCATFSYSSDDAKKATQQDYYNSLFYLAGNTENFNHPAGHYCFQLKIPSSYVRKLVPSPSPYVRPTPIPFPSSTDNQVLVNKIFTDGTVSVLVRINVDYVSEGQLTSEQVKGQRLFVSQMRQKLVDQLKKYNVNINSDSENWIKPYLVLTTGKEGLDFLTQSTYVRSIEEYTGQQP